MGKTVLKRFIKNKRAVIGLVIFGVLLFLALTADLYIDYDTQVINQNIASQLQGPSPEHWMGTDAYGRDIFFRLIYGTRVSLAISFSTMILATFFGVVIGSSCGYFGGRLDIIVMRIMDVFLSIPAIILAIAIVASLGTGAVNLVIAMTLSYIPSLSRIVRSAVMSVKNNDYVRAAKAMGASNFRIITTHVLTNALGPIIVQFTLGIGDAIMGTAGLGFLGLGIQPPLPEWGNMLAAGKEYIRYMPYMVVFPGLFIMLTVLSLNLIGDALRDALDARV